MGKDYIEKSLSYYLFARPSMSEGIGRVLDMGTTMQVYNESPDAAMADYLALASDWVMVGNDMRQVINDYEREFSTASAGK